jgi:hypothetical protein
MKKLSAEDRVHLVQLAKALTREAIGLSGAASVVWGVAMIYVPAGLIVGGLAAAAWAYFAASQDA